MNALNIHDCIYFQNSTQTPGVDIMSFTVKSAIAVRFAETTITTMMNNSKNENLQATYEVI